MTLVECRVEQVTLLIFTEEMLLQMDDFSKQVIGSVSNVKVHTDELIHCGVQSTPVQRRNGNYISEYSGLSMGKGHLGKRQSIADSQSFFSQTVADRILLYSSAGLKWEYTSTRAHMQPTLNNKTDRHAPTWME